MKEDDINEGFWVFVSHSTKDFERVRLVRNALEDSGFRPILFYLKCLENENEVNDLLKREIDARKRFILCDSPNAQASKFVQSEVEYIRSKKRMYEIIDLTQIDIEGQNAEKEVLELVKTFLKRINVFLFCVHQDGNLVALLKDYLTLQGFNVTDISCYKNLNKYSKLEERTDAIYSAIINMPKNGYLLFLIGDFESYFMYESLQYSIRFAPNNMILPVIINGIGYNNISQFLDGQNFVDVSKIPSDKEKAKAIVDALIDFDLRNNK